MAEAAKRFFGASHYGVVGANSDPSRFGHKVFAWYLRRGLPVTPVTPSSAQVTVGADSYDTVATVGELTSPAESSSLSLITPPPVTVRILTDARKAGVRSVWLQPGTYDEETLKMLRDDDWWQGRWVAGEDGASRGHGGWCVLVDGDKARQAAASSEAQQHL